MSRNCGHSHEQRHRRGQRHATKTRFRVSETDILELEGDIIWTKGVGDKYPISRDIRCQGHQFSTLCLCSSARHQTTMMIRSFSLKDCLVARFKRSEIDSNYFALV